MDKDISETSLKLSKGLHLQTTATSDKKYSETNFTFQKENTNCVSCEKIKKVTPSSLFCASCDSSFILCDSCAQIHLAKDQFQNHRIIKLDEMSSDVIETHCEQCLADEEEVQAVSFCLDCEDPEPLCSKCSKIHLKQKAFRKHNLCHDLQELLKRKEAPNKEGSMDDQATSSFVKGGEKISTPTCKDATSESVDLTWRIEGVSVDYFLIRYKKETDTRWKMFETEDNTCSVKIEGLSPGSSYIFQVKGIKNGEDCAESQESKRIRTKSLSLNAPEVLQCTHDMVLLQIKDNHTRNLNKTELELRFRSEKAKSWKSSVVTLENQTVACNNLHENTLYEFQVRRLNCDFEEDYSLPVNARTGLRPMEIPSVFDIKHDQILLTWKSEKKDIDYFQIRYKIENTDVDWQFIKVAGNENSRKITQLRPDTTYIFQIRYVKGGQMEAFSEEFARAKTKKSLALEMKDMSELQSSSNPPVYRLSTTEIKRARNERAKSRKIILGSSDVDSSSEKTILLVGATGSGKSTLVDGIINYVLGVRYEDPFRFTLVHLEKGEMKSDQSMSQTEWITEYKIPQRSNGRLAYTLNIIDTPGFGDTRGIQRDEALAEQIRMFFSAKGCKGVSRLNAICFIIKAPDARLTSAQKYIFYSIMSLFGKDVEEIICTLITFADGTKPPALASLKAASLPVDNWLPFNNSGLFADNSSKFASLFWDMGCKSFESFFDTIEKHKPISLTLTKEVLKKRAEIEEIVICLQSKIKAGLSKLDQLKKRLKLFKEHQSDIEKNKDFTYTEDETKQVTVPLPKGQHITTCLQCHETCHENCAYKDDADKINCTAMRSDGHCNVCDNHCKWDDHKNTPFMYKLQTIKVTKTYKETKRKYEEAKGKKMSDKKFLLNLTKELKEFDLDVLGMVQLMKGYKNALRRIALRPDPLTLVDHLNQMIKAEEKEHEDGWEDRIKILEGYIERAELDKTCEGLSKAFQEAIEEVEKESGGFFSFSPFDFMRKLIEF